MMTWLTGTTSPPVSRRWLPMRTLIVWGGNETGEATAVDVSDEQWPAVSTVSGEMSVPVQWNSRSVPN